MDGAWWWWHYMFFLSSLDFRFEYLFREKLKIHYLQGCCVTWYLQVQLQLVVFLSSTHLWRVRPCNILYHHSGCSSYNTSRMCSNSNCYVLKTTKYRKLVIISTLFDPPKKWWHQLYILIVNASTGGKFEEPQHV